MKKHFIHESHLLSVWEDIGMGRKKRQCTVCDGQQILNGGSYATSGLLSKKCFIPTTHSFSTILANTSAEARANFKVECEASIRTKCLDEAKKGLTFIRMTFREIHPLCEEDVILKALETSELKYTIGKTAVAGRHVDINW